MRKYFLITSIFFIYLFPAFSQDANTIWFDSLKKQLSSQRDSAKVDVLNELADAFRTMGPYPAWDSVYKYAIAANKEALKIGYKKGEAFSLLNLPSSETKDPSHAEAHIEQAISIGESIKEPKILGKSYLHLSYGLKKEHRIEVLKKALAYCEQANDTEGEMEANELLCDDYTSNGKYEEGFTYCDKCAKLIKQATLTPWGHEWALWYFLHMAKLYQRAGDYEASLESFRQGNQYAQKNQVSWNLDLNMIDAFTQLGQYDSAFYYWKKFENNASPYVLNHRVYWSSVLGEIYLKTKQYDKALDIAKEGIAFFKKQKSTGFSLTGHLLSAAKVYTEMKNYKSALEYAKEGLVLAKKNDMLTSIISADQLLANIYHQLGNKANAYNYLSQYYALKDSIQNHQFLLRMYNFKKETEEEKKTSQINLLNKDNQLKEQKLKQEEIVRNSLVGGFILVFVLALFVFRNLSLKRKNERAELQRKATELEAQALRAQMNPHFIFNCLSSINKFILKNDTDAASDYLTRFSRLIRFVLTNSQLSLVPLNDEIEMLRLYLDMERLRFSNSFDYNIIYANTIEPETIYIPPMLLQPFCENAIWHGMMPKDGRGKLEVMMSIQDHQLECVITDNGIGRKKAAELKTKSGTKQKSVGLKITTERLALFNNEKSLHDFYRTEDMLDGDGTVAGTRVTLNIKFKNAIQQSIKETAE
jgi:tetratricopeptide (TPR) repeat protein